MKHLSEEHLVSHYSQLGNFTRDFRNANLFRLITTLIKEHRIVDVGCGAGFFAKMLEDQGKKVTGIEPNEGMRTLAQKLHPHVHVLAGMAEEITELITEKPECVTMLDVLEHVEDDNAQVARVWSVLPENGTFVLVVPAYQYLYGKRDIAMGHYRRYSKASLEAVLTKNGFRVDSIRFWNALGVFPYFFSEKILKKPLRIALREDEHTNIFKEFLRTMVNVWVREIENRCNFGFGLSIICVARKIEKT